MYNLKELGIKYSNQIIKYASGGAIFLTASLITLYKIQGKIIYHPVIPGMYLSPKDNPHGYRNPGEYKLQYENLEIKTNDNIILRGWLIKQKNDSEKCPTVIFFHENAGNIGTRLDFLNYYYNKVNVNLVIIAYRGFSDSDKAKIDQKGLELDVEAILDYIFQRKDLNLNNIYTHGRSLGGATSIYGLQLNKYPIKGAIIENTFTSIEDVGSTFLPSYIMKFSSLVLKNKWKSIERIGNVNCPVLFIKSMQDELIPYQQMDSLYEKCKAPKKQFIIEEGDHNSNWTVDVNNYFQNIKQFIQQNENQSNL